MEMARASGRSRIEGRADSRWSREGKRAECRRMLLLTHGAGTGFEFGLCRPETASLYNTAVLLTIVPHTSHVEVCACMHRPPTQFYSKSVPPAPILLLRPWNLLSRRCSPRGNSRESGTLECLHTQRERERERERERAFLDNIYSPSTRPEREQVAGNLDRKRVIILFSK